MNLNLDSARGPHPHPAALATLAQDPAPVAAGRVYLGLRLGTGDYGIDLRHVLEVRAYEAPTRIAHTPPFVQGVLKLRGVLVPIVDLRLPFGDLDPCRLADHDACTAVVVLEVRGRVVGVVVDSVSGEFEPGRDELRPDPERRSTIDPRFVTGVAAVRHAGADRRLILIDIEALMSSAGMGLMDGAR
jgi:purine-binding chemotaxis protein CheW